MSGPAASAISPPKPTSEPTRSQRPRTSSPLRRSASYGASILELDDRREQRPADGEPERDRDQDDARREDDEHGDEDRDRAEQRPDPAQREPVRVERPDVASGVDLDERARCRRLDEPEAEQRQRRPDDDRDVRERAGEAARDARDRVDARDQEPLHGGDDDDDRDQEEPEPDEQARSASRTSARTRRGSGPTCGGAPTRSGATGVHVARTTAKTSSAEEHPSTRTVAPGFRSSLARAAEPRSTPEQKRSVAPVPSTPPVGTA